ncbi:MAG: hypothetical protein V7606_576 [Burkholderiales bacterium]|nr:hypothetical protein [Burkholderia sp.]
MNERTFSSFETATTFAILMKKLCGNEPTVVQLGAEWVVRPGFGQKTIVEVTEALLRQVNK